MFTFFAFVGFLWLFFQGVSLAFHLTWGIAKVVGSLLMLLALPIMALCLLVFGGVVVLLPLLMVGAAVVILKVCG